MLVVAALLPEIVGVGT